MPLSPCVRFLGNHVSCVLFHCNSNDPPQLSIDPYVADLFLTNELLKRSFFCTTLQLEKLKCMASIRLLKKKINTLCDGFQNECYVELMFGTSNEVEMVWGLMGSCDKLHKNTLCALNRKLNKSYSRKERKAYYRHLTDEFYKDTFALINELNSVIP